MKILKQEGNGSRKKILFLKEGKKEMLRNAKTNKSTLWTSSKRGKNPETNSIHSV